MRKTLDKFNRVTVFIVFLIALLGLAAAPVQAGFFDKEKLRVNDLAFGDVLFHFYQDNFFSATVKLMVAKELGQLPNHEQETDLLLAGLFLSNGLHLEAEALFRRVIAQGASPEVQDRAWYYLGKMRYQKGLYDDAIRALEELQGKLPKDLQDDSRLQMANLLMSRGQYSQASKLLENLSTSDEVAAYAHFNLGIALFKSGKKIRGVEYLDNIGLLETDKSEIKALKDKANIALGYALLTNKEIDKAKAYFQRVRLNGPFSNKALLGLGWTNAIQENFKAALTPWMALARRSRNDSSVYEAMLAVPYALEKLQAFPQSMQSYQQAIHSFEEEIGNIDKAIKTVQSGVLWGELFKHLSQKEQQRILKPEHFSKIVDSRYIYSMIAGHTFQEAVKNLKNLQFIRSNLGYWADDIPTFKNMLDLRRQAYEERLPKLMPEQGNYKLAAINDERNLYKEELQRIITDQDLNALANDKEFENLERLQKIRLVLNRAQGQIDDKKYQQYLQKYRLFSGLMEWDIGTSISPRIWKIQKGMRILEKEIKKTAKRQESLNRARTIAPQGFLGHSKIIDSYARKVTKLQNNVDALFDQQKQELERLLVSELIVVKTNLSEYADQARFALARLQDLGAIKGAVEE